MRLIPTVRGYPHDRFQRRLEPLWVALSNLEHVRYAGRTSDDGARGERRGSLHLIHARGGSAHLAADHRALALGDLAQFQHLGQARLAFDEFGGQRPGRFFSLLLEGIKQDQDRVQEHGDSQRQPKRFAQRAEQGIEVQASGNARKTRRLVHRSLSGLIIRTRRPCDWSGPLKPLWIGTSIGAFSYIR